MWTPGEGDDPQADSQAREHEADGLGWAVIFIPMPLPNQVLQTSYCTHLF